MGLSPRLRLAWFAVTAFVVIFGVGEFVRWVLIDPAGGPGWWGIDLKLVIEAGTRLSAGQPIYADARFLYPPLAAILAAPLGGLDFLPVSIVYALVKIALAVACVTSLARPVPRLQQLEAILILVLCLPFLHDVMLGNANVLLVAAMVPALFGSDRPRSGVLLGLATAVFAKPLIGPILLWLLFWRRKTLLGTVISGLLATGAAMLITGPASYVDWVRALMTGTQFAAPFAGNHGVTALVPALWLPIALLTLAGLLFVLARRSERTGIAWAAAAGLLIAPYAGTYSALPMALAVPGFLETAPVYTLAIVALSTIGTGFALPFYAAAALVAALVVRDRPSQATIGKASIGASRLEYATPPPSELRIE